MGTVFIEGVPINATERVIRSAIRNTFLKTTNACEWLKKGELVLLKPALNSPGEYPATTHPLAVDEVSRILEEKGARVVVGDQSGIGHVIHSPQGLTGSTRQAYQHSGMKLRDDLKFVAFEEEGWQEGFFKFTHKKLFSWDDGLYITKWVQKTDHIINLPRLSTHAQAGVTLGFKSLVGLLREDSRLEFHSHGPFYFGISRYAKHTGMKTSFAHRDFFKAMTEIMLAVQEKLRATLFVATKAQTSIGPDQYIIPFIKSHVETPHTGLVFASNNPVSAEAFAIAFLTRLYQHQSLAHKFVEKALLFANRQAHELGKQPVWNNPFLTHALTLNIGTKELALSYKNVPEPLKKWLSQRLAT